MNNFNYLKTKDILFIHIPKTGGTFLAGYFEESVTTHAKAYQIIQNIGMNEFKNYFTFTFVRDPIERFVSTVNYALMPVSLYHNNINPEMGRFGEHLDFKTIKNLEINEVVNFLELGLLKHDDNWNHWEPQTSWFLYGGINVLDRVFRMDEIEVVSQFVDLISQKQYYKEIVKPKRNESKKIFSLKDLTQDSIDRLKKYYSQDYDFLGEL